MSANVMGPDGRAGVGTAAWDCAGDAALVDCVEGPFAVAGAGWDLQPAKKIVDSMMQQAAEVRDRVKNEFRLG